MLERHRNRIGGEDSDPGGEIPCIDPATGEEISSIPDSPVEEIDRAVTAARAALPDWKGMPAPRRGEILFRVSRILAERKEDLARLLTRENGKPIGEARGDIQEAVDMAAYMGGEGRRAWGQTVPSELPGKHMMTFREPVGVVAAITPWNFPVAVPSWKLMPALVLGNTVVWKPAEETPGCARALTDILEEAGLPPGVLNLVYGRGEIAGAALCAHPGVNLVAFTGSTETGRAVNEACAPSFKRVLLEMGGKNGIYVHEDADLDLALEGILWAAFGTSGQRCTAASRSIVHRKVAGELIPRVVEGAKSLRVGSGLDPAVRVGPIVHAEQLAKIERYVGIGREEGAYLCCGGKRAAVPGCEGGFFFEPTVFDRVAPEMRIAREEIFGPVLAAIEVDSYEAGIEVLNGTDYGLSASVYTRDVSLAFDAMRRIETGLVYINAGTTGSEVSTPFGGMKGTGNGHREAGQAALETFSEWKAVFVDASGRLQRAQIDA